jgi:hypothetical protein
MTRARSYYGRGRYETIDERYQSTNKGKGAGFGVALRWKLMYLTLRLLELSEGNKQTLVHVALTEKLDST